LHWWLWEKGEKRTRWCLGKRRVVARILHIKEKRNACRKKRKHKGKKGPGRAKDLAVKVGSEIETMREK